MSNSEKSAARKILAAKPFVLTSLGDYLVNVFGDALVGEADGVEEYLETLRSDDRVGLTAQESSLIAAQMTACFAAYTKKSKDSQAIRYNIDGALDEVIKEELFLPLSKQTQRS